MREFYILTTTYRLFSFFIYDRINNNDPITFKLRELCIGQEKLLFIPQIIVDFQNSDEFFGAFLQPSIDNAKNETWIGLFNTANGGCRLRFIINIFPF